jgi:hypothetical protein
MSSNYMAENLPFIAKNQRPLAVLSSTSLATTNIYAHAMCWMPINTNKIGWGYGPSNVPYYGQMIVITE